VAIESQRPCPTLETVPAPQLLGPGHIPDAEGAILAAGGQRLAVGAERDRLDVVGVSLQEFVLLASLHGPEADGAVPTARGEHPPVRREGDAGDTVLVPPQTPQIPA